ncbi:MAG: M28 family peptidase [Bacteroidaceae bacterium]|nr:M28 family peptidase [Bacteroidaceae bacterium]
MKYILIVILTALLGACGGKSGRNAGGPDTITLAPCPTFNTDTCMKYIQEQCDFGPRVTGSEAAKLCRQYLAGQFRRMGATVEEQQANVTLWDGSERPACNIIARLNPGNQDRILICSHWDSRPWADNDEDEQNHRTPVPAANDGASGVAMMMEICRLLQQKPVKTGIDFVCFDAEDMGTPQWAETEESTSDTWCLGSRFWAERAREEGYRARYGILLDMVGGRGSVFPAEKVSQEYAQPIASLMIRLGNQLGYGHYFPLNREGGYLMDDHVNVNRIARVPCIDIVPYFTDGPSSFGPTWHTVNDTPENIDPNVLEAVGQTLTQLIYNEEL